MAITKSNKHKLSLDHNKSNKKGVYTLATLLALMSLNLGFSNLNHFTRFLLSKALSRVFLS